MATTQANQPLALHTAAWKDTLLMTGLTGQEGVSRLFRFEFEFVVENEKLKTPLAFHKLLGEPLAARFLQGGAGHPGGANAPAETRYFSGVCAEFAQGATDEKFTAFRAVVVPKLWLLTRRARSRIFQQESVKAILLKVLKETHGGKDELVDEMGGKYEPRDYCVQYRETDFNFVSRLMEEEGIYYFFRHTEKGHELVVADAPKSHPPLPRAATLATGFSESERSKCGTSVLVDWHKRQELRSGRTTLWDHTFEIPHDSLAASVPTQGKTKAGSAVHELAVPANAALEVYDWPGEYAQRFDGVPPGGGERPGDPQKARTDNERTTKIRMEQAAAGAVSVTGAGEWGLMFAGAKLTVTILPADLKANFYAAVGDYVLTSVSHSVSLGNVYRSGGAGVARYSNHFTAVPFDLPVRPDRASPKPFVQGSQTAVVVGPPKEEIFTDKYGRVKVQFHWHREGKRNAESSCWIRVAHLSAGRQWGAFSLPRVGQEVVVDFLEGDPDQPIIVGCVYNPDQMPMYKLPDHKTRSYIKTNSSPGGRGFNEVRFEDKAGAEQIFIHGQRNQDVRIRNDSLEKVGHDRHSRYGFYIPPRDDDAPPPEEKKHGSLFEEVAVNHHVKVHKNKDEHVGGDVKLLIGGIDGDGNLDVHVKKDHKELVDGTRDTHVKQAVTEKYDASHDATVGGARTETLGEHDQHVKKGKKVKVDQSVSLTVGQDYQEKTGKKHAVDAGQEIHLKAGMKIIIEAGAQLSLKGPGGFIDIGPTGVTIQGKMVLINSGGAAGSGSGSSPEAPKDAKAPKDALDANPTKPTEADSSVTGKKSNSDTN